jgi:DNA primase
MFCKDHSDHLGISDDGFYHCWLCDSKGTVIRLVQEIEGGISEVEARSILSGFLRRPEDVRIPRKTPTLLSFPMGSLPLQFIHSHYLKKRGYNPKQIVTKYQIQGIGMFGQYPYRIVIPVFRNGKMVNYVCRDITGKAEQKYKACPNKDAVIPLKHCLYNIDSVKDVVLIVEGPLDVWRMGDGCIATFGTAFTNNQIQELVAKKIRKAIVMYDAQPETAIIQASKLAGILSGFIREVGLINLSSGDPGSLSDEEAQSYREEIFQ